MNNNQILNNLGEIEIIKIIEELIYEKTKKKLIKDDSFFFSLKNEATLKEFSQTDFVLNSDMLVSTTDIPPQMSSYQIGRKAILMNLSDLIVKGVKPKGIVISLGLSKDMELRNFKDLMIGIIDSCIKWNLDYIGGDINETKELIINPTVFGFQDRSKIIYRTGLNPGDYLITNGKFGLTGVGFDILLNKKGDSKSYPSYKRSIMSVLEPTDIGIEALILSQNNFATSSIDSSDGLAKSLKDLIRSNPNINIGFEIDFNDDLIDKEALNYAQKYNLSLETLIFDAGEEFIHIFTIDPKKYDSVQKLIQIKGGQIFKIGRVTSDKKIYIIKDDRKKQLTSSGFEHFS
ncbi:MAG: thiamine-monophosphate kinase [Promethearchaeota archaeon]